MSGHPFVIWELYVNGEVPGVSLFNPIFVKITLVSCLRLVSTSSQSSSLSGSFRSSGAVMDDGSRPLIAAPTAVGRASHLSTSRCVVGHSGCHCDSTQFRRVRAHVSPLFVCVFRLHIFLTIQLLCHWYLHPWVRTTQFAHRKRPCIKGHHFDSFSTLYIRTLTCRVSRLLKSLLKQLP